MTVSKNDSIQIEAVHFETGKPVRITIKDGNIWNISEVNHKIKHKNVFVAPGLIDNQINGYQGINFSEGNFTPEQFSIAVESIWSHGVTSFMPTVITNTHENLLRNFSALCKALDAEKLLEDTIPGFHLEGPYISPENGYRGTHDPACIRKPSWEEFMEYQKASGNMIIQVTVAPEIDGATELIRQCVRHNIVVAMGHTNASSAEINNSVDNGVRLSTHLGNGCANMIHRHKNPIWPQLANDLLTISVIGDGQHLPPEVIRTFFRMKGPDKFILTSDVNYMIGLPPGRYMFSGTEVVYSEDGLVKNPKENCLAGASLPLKKGIEIMMNYTGCSLAEAVRLATINVARIYKLYDRGSLESGKRADLILFGMEGNILDIMQTWLKGKIVYSRPGFEN